MRNGLTAVVLVFLLVCSATSAGQAVAPQAAGGQRVVAASEPAPKAPSLLKRAQAFLSERIGALSWIPARGSLFVLKLAVARPLNPLCEAGGSGCESSIGLPPPPNCNCDPAFCNCNPPPPPPPGPDYQYPY